MVLALAFHLLTDCICRFLNLCFLPAASECKALTPESGLWEQKPDLVFESPFSNSLLKQNSELAFCPPLSFAIAPLCGWNIEQKQNGNGRNCAFTFGKNSIYLLDVSVKWTVYWGGSTHIRFITHCDMLTLEIRKLVQIASKDPFLCDHMRQRQAWLFPLVIIQPA